MVAGEEARMRSGCRRGAAVLALSTAVAVGISFGTPPASADSAVPDPIRVGRYENPPKVYTDSQGRAAGLFPEILQAMAAEEHWNLEWVDCEWSQCLQLLESGQLDLMPDVAFSEERAAAFDFHKVSVASSWSQVYSSPTLHVSTLTELAGARIALLAGGIQRTAFAKLMHEAGLDFTEVLAASYEAAYAAVKADRADAVITNTFYAAYNNARFGLRETPIVFLPSNLFFAAPPGSNRALLDVIDRRLVVWRSDPDSIYWAALHRAMAPTPGSFVPSWVRATVYGLAGGLLLVTLLALFLRRQVRTRTRRLVDTEARNVELASLDQLTGLPNRAYYTNHLHGVLNLAHRQGLSVGLVFLDIDGFAGVNESYGHQMGDCVLLELVDRLRAVLGDEGILARTGGDEFAVVVMGAENLDKLAQGLIDASLAPIIIDDRSVHVGLSAGAAVFPLDGADADALQSSADAALQVAKSTGHRSLRLASPEFTRAARERMVMLSALRVAAESGELRLHYQPQVDARSGRIVGVEALVRWERPGIGLVMPGSFIPLAEHSGLIVPIGAWVLDQVARQIRQWSDEGIAPARTAVNMSAVQLRDPGIVVTVQSALATHAIRPDALELEITESFIMRDPVQSLGAFEALRSLGVSMSIDDFGTGYSSMRYLQDLRVHRLKLDMSFVHHIMTNDIDAAIVRAIIMLGHSLGLEVIAEGVETVDQALRLRECDCDVLQGYVAGRPCSADAMTALLREGVVHTVGIWG